MDERIACPSWTPSRSKILPPAAVVAETEVIANHHRHHGTRTLSAQIFVDLIYKAHSSGISTLYRSQNPHHKQPGRPTLQNDQLRHLHRLRHRLPLVLRRQEQTRKGHRRLPRRPPQYHRYLQHHLAALLPQPPLSQNRRQQARILQLEIR